MINKLQKFTHVAKYATVKSKTIIAKDVSYVLNENIL